MSLATITQAATADQALADRVTAAGQKEARNNPTFADTERGALLREQPGYAVAWFSWPVAIDYEAQYESALVAGNPDPGGDPAVITDANIGAAVQAHWPPDTALP